MRKMLISMVFVVGLTGCVSDTSDARYAKAGLRYAVELCGGEYNIERFRAFKSEPDEALVLNLKCSNRPEIFRVELPKEHLDKLPVEK